MFGFAQKISEIRVLNSANRLAKRDRYRDAIDLLTSANRIRRSSRFEEQLVELRYEAFFHQTFPTGFPEWPPPIGSRFADHVGIPEITREQLSADVVRDGVFNRGSIMVRGLLNQDEAERLRQLIDLAYFNHDLAESGAPRSQTSPWFAPFVPSNSHGDQDFPRTWFRETGAELAADSPRALFELLEIFRANGIIEIISNYLGESCALSVKKTSLRMVPHNQNAEHGWHQDGAFLGEGIRTVNVWIALNDCGIDSPSMDMAPRRLDYIVPTGTEGAIFDWSVSSSQIKEACNGGEPAHLHFAAGDAIFFDEMNLHRTSTLPGMTKPRYAIEAWFFAPSCYPLDQLPLLV